jgi:hypothetical protein
MQTFNEYLFEMSIAMLGDWKDGYANLTPISKLVTDKNWELITTIEISGDVYELRKLKEKEVYILGKFVEAEDLELTTNELVTKFNVVFQINLGRDYKVESQLSRIGGNYTRIANVNGVVVDTSMQGKGIALTIYKWLVNDQGFVIMGDSKQYFGARKLWSKLSKQHDIVVDLVDIKRGKLIESHVKLHQGDHETDFDARLWSLGKEKKNIRPVLRKIL